MKSKQIWKNEFWQ